MTHVDTRRVTGIKVTGEWLYIKPGSFKWGVSFDGQEPDPTYGIATHNDRDQIVFRSDAVEAFYVSRDLAPPEEPDADSH